MHSLEDLLTHLKVTYAEHRNMSQLNTALAIVAQREGETVLNYETRVGKILTSLIELIEEKNHKNSATVMIKSARDTARENFLIGLKKELVMRVRVGIPNTLQEALNIARTAEWEAEYESGLNRKNPHKVIEDKGEIVESCNSKNRFFY